MLNERLIDEYFDKQQDKFVNVNDYAHKMSDNHLQIYGLQAINGRLLGIGKYLLSVKSLMDMDNQLVLSYYTNSAVFPDDYDKRVVRNKSWKWLKNFNTNVWEHNCNIGSYEELYHYILMNQKVAAMDTMLMKIEYHRKVYAERFLGQDLIYTSKYLEAKEIIEKNIQSDPILDYPYVTGYANTIGVSLQDAANEVLVQWQIQSGFLAETDNLRIKYTKDIRKEKHLENLKVILDAFSMASHSYSSL